MTKSTANALLQSRTSDNGAEARLLADVEYVEIRDRVRALPETRSERTAAQQAELSALVARKYEIVERLAA